MTRTKKIIAGIIVTIVVLLLAAYMSVDAIAASVLRSEGTTILGVKTDVASIRLGLFGAQTSVKGLSIANPEGFDKPEFVHLDRVDIAASVFTLLSSTIDIPTVKLDGLTLDLEQVGDRLNATVIVDHVAKAIDVDDDDDDEGDPVKLNIGVLEITNIKLTASGSIVNLAGGRLDATIGSFSLKDVGTNTNGDDVTEQVVSLALEIVLKHIKDNPVRGLSGAAVGSLATALGKVPGFRELGAGKVLLDVNRKLNEGLGRATQGVKDLGGGILDDVSDLIGGGSKAGDATGTGDSDGKGGGS